MDTTSIETLRTEAAEAGDLAMVAVCERALAGSERDIEECERVIRDARAMED